jgi:hypothetical protein
MALRAFPARALPVTEALFAALGRFFSRQSSAQESSLADAHFWNLKTTLSANPYLPHIHRVVKREQNHNKLFIINDKQNNYRSPREWHSSCTTHSDKYSLSVRG